jgi:hypothetical protein
MFLVYPWSIRLLIYALSINRCRFKEVLIYLALVSLMHTNTDVYWACAMYLATIIRGGLFQPKIANSDNPRHIFPTMDVSKDTSRPWSLSMKEEIWTWVNKRSKRRSHYFYMLAKMPARIYEARLLLLCPVRLTYLRGLQGLRWVDTGQWLP